MWRRNGKVNERDVPESQHTIFVRGLPGHMGTDEIREFFEKDFGACTFDFVKMSPDRTKLYIAVRFDSKSMAREVMERFNGSDLLGYKVELTWFRDIRRYLAHCAKKGVRPRRSREGEGSGGHRDGGRERRRSRSRSGVAHSRSQSVASPGSRDSRSYSRSVDSHSRSKSNSSSGHSAERPAGKRDKSLDYNDIVKKERPPSPSPTPPPIKKSKKDKKKERKRKRKYSPSSSPERHSGASEAETNAAPNGVNKQQQMVFIGPTKQSSPQRDFTQCHPPIGTVSATNNGAMLTKPKAEMVYNQQITLDLSDPKNNYPPKFKPIGEASSVDYLLNGSKEQRIRVVDSEQRSNMSSPPPPALRNMPSVKLNSAEKEIGSGPAALNNFKEIQRAILQDVRYKPQEAEDDEGLLGSLRLSSLSRKAMTEEKREEKMAKLSPELRERINKKKRQLELSYRSDCETYGLVANKLIAKDRSMEDRIKVALLDTMKELETETMKQLDDFLDQLSFMF